MDTYTTAELIESVQPLRVSPKFFLTFFPTIVTSDKKEISFDFEEDDLTLAPFVSPLIAGKAKRDQGFATKSFVPAYVKPKDVVDPSKMLERLPGEAFGGTVSPEERRNRTILKLLQQHRGRIERREEAMVAEFLRTGKMIVAGEGYPKQEVDFGRAAAHTATLAGGSKWGDNGVSPFDNVDGWCDTVATAIGAAADVVIFGKAAWKLYAADPKLDKSMDRTKGQNSLVELGYQSGDPGAPQYKGSVGVVDMFVYNGVYKNEANDITRLLDDNGVVVLSRAGLAGRRCYGAIQDASNLRAEQFYPKNWIENDPGVEFLMTQSAPLPVPGRPDATLYRKVA